MSVRLRDPASMTPAERLAELGALLATAVRRMRANPGNGLAGGADPERPCDPLVDTPESTKEVA